MLTVRAWQKMLKIYFVMKRSAFVNPTTGAVDSTCLATSSESCPGTCEVQLSCNCLTCVSACRRLSSKWWWTNSNILACVCILIGTVRNGRRLRKRGLQCRDSDLEAFDTNGRLSSRSNKSLSSMIENSTTRVWFCACLVSSNRFLCLSKKKDPMLGLHGNRNVTFARAHIRVLACLLWDNAPQGCYESTCQPLPKIWRKTHFRGSGIYVGALTSLGLFSSLGSTDFFPTVLSKAFIFKLWLSSSKLSDSDDGYCGDMKNGEIAFRFIIFLGWWRFFFWLERCSFCCASAIEIWRTKRNRSQRPPGVTLIPPRAVTNGAVV